MGLFLGCITVFIILSTVVTAVFYMQKNDRSEKVRCEKMIMDVFKMQIKQPELSLVYDAAKHDASSELLEKYEQRKDAFILYVLSVFDLVIDYYYGRSIYAVKDPVMKSAWLNTVTNFYRDSSDGRNTYQTHREEFNSRFQSFSDEILGAFTGAEGS